MGEVAILSKKECHVISRFRHEFPMGDPALQFGLDWKEVCAKSRCASLNLLNRLEHFSRGSNRTHAAQLAAATSLARSILPFGFRGICCIQLKTLGSIYLGTRGDNFSRIKPGVSSLSLS